jgi:hypothetical protein
MITGTVSARMSGIFMVKTKWVGSYLKVALGWRYRTSAIFNHFCSYTVWHYHLDPEISSLVSLLHIRTLWHRYLNIPLNKGWFFQMLSSRQVSYLNILFPSLQIPLCPEELFYQFFFPRISVFLNDILFLFIYSHVHTLFGSFLPQPTAPTLSPPPPLASRYSLFCLYL